MRGKRGQWYAHSLEGASRLLLDHHALAQDISQFLGEGARQRIDAAARGKRHHDAHRL
ncbi:hypothetical protein AZ24_1708, partial [Bordetella bronchiseptica E013]